MKTDSRTRHAFNADVNELSECQHCGWPKDHDIHAVVTAPGSKDGQAEEMKALFIRVGAEQSIVEVAIERMARAGCKDSLPTNGMFNEHQLDVMFGERLPTYRLIARVMFFELLTGAKP